MVILTLIDADRVNRAKILRSHSLETEEPTVFERKKWGTASIRRMFGGKKRPRVSTLAETSASESVSLSNSSTVSSCSLDDNNNGKSTSMREPKVKLRPHPQNGIISRPTSLHGEENLQVDCTKTISSDGALLRSADTPDFQKAPSTTGSLSSDGGEKRSDHEHSLDSPDSRTFAKKKYFSDRGPNKNIFKKYFHPTFHQRSVQFKKIFGGTVEDDDQLLYTFSCAFQREILAQGRMFISQKNVCFYANILSWETLFAIPIKEISGITKEKAAKIFPNSIQIETKGDEKYFFASFVNREKTFNVLETVWKNTQESKTMSPEELWEILNPEEDEQKYEKPVKVKKARSVELMNKHHSAPMLNSASPVLCRPDSEFPSIVESADSADYAAAEEALEEVECPCTSHHGRMLMDKIVPITVDEVFALLFTDTPWYKKFNDRLKNTVHHKVSDQVSSYSASSWATDKDAIKQRICTYTIALNHAMAPKSCVVTEKQISNHYGGPNECFVVNKETQQSGVPYSDSFTVLCTYCVTRVNHRETRIRVHGGINYKKSIWGVIKTYIEKNTQQGLEDHYAALDSVLEEEIQRKREDREGEEGAEEQEREPSTSSAENLAEDRREHNVNKKINTFRRDHNLTTSVSTGFNYLQTEQTAKHDKYIKIVIVLLSAILFVNILILWRATFSTVPEEAGASRTAVSSSASDDRFDQQQMVLDGLVDTVKKVTAELRELRSSVKQEL